MWLWHFILRLLVGFLVLLLHLLIYFLCTLSHSLSVGGNDRRGSVDKKDATGCFLLMKCSSLKSAVSCPVLEQMLVRSDSCDN
jgi:hypothetical protein